MHQYDWLPGSPYRVLKFDGLQGCPIQVPLLHHVRP
jgi:hypothetical protein